MESSCLCFCACGLPNAIRRKAGYKPARVRPRLQPSANGRRLAFSAFQATRRHFHIDRSIHPPPLIQSMRDPRSSGLSTPTQTGPSRWRHRQEASGRGGDRLIDRRAVPAARSRIAAAASSRRSQRGTPRRSTSYRTTMKRQLSDASVAVLLRLERLQVRGLEGGAVTRAGAVDVRTCVHFLPYLSLTHFP